MKDILYLISLLIISTITVSSQTQCPFEDLCESCIEDGGFYCGDNPENWTNYSPHGCVPHYYLISCKTILCVSGLEAMLDHFA